MSAGGDESGESSQMFESGEEQMSQSESNEEEGAEAPITHEL